ncbi:hypothetical protein ACHAWU_003035 [Discostella pseudostelligera]|uniref:Protein kinase domain-containing protein n=1 Tax=Discostella pseudostelligera TaxID=259834 RepID=A0ABD3M4K5_9STRA
MASASSTSPEAAATVSAASGSGITNGASSRTPLVNRRSNPIISTEDDEIVDEVVEVNSSGSPNYLQKQQQQQYVNNKAQNSSFDIDASITRLRGSGYLASAASLSTPTDVFAAGCTLLQLCAIGNLSSVIEYINKSFPNVNFQDYDRRTALHVAASEGHLPVVKYLIAQGAKINRTDRWGGSPLDDSHRHQHTDVARYLRAHGARTGSLNLLSRLITAAAAGDLEEVTMLCADSKVLDLSSSRGGRGVGGGIGSSAMSRIGSTSKLSEISTSLGRVARMGGGGGGGKSPLSTPLDGSSPSAATAAAAEPVVDINEGDYDKRTALHVAAGGGHVDVVLYLCKQGANVNVEDQWGGRPLDDALEKGHDKVVEILRQFGAKTKASTSTRMVSSRSVFGSTTGAAATGSTHDSMIDDDPNFSVDFSELEMIERIGSGAFGEIYKCRWRGILVAAKCIKASKIQKEWLLKNRTGMSSKDRRANRLDAIKQTAITDEEKQLALEDFRKETSILRRLRHPNIVMMLAYSHSDDVEVMISEICKCSLLDIFNANKISNSQIPKRTQIIYAQQLAQGMNHLHKSHPPIIHRDLKPANLLVDFSGTLKIADFGLAKIRPNPEQIESEVFMMTGETGSYRFMAPEVFRHETYTESVDIYSYSMIFYHILLGLAPWAGFSGLDAVTKAAMDGERPLIPRNIDERLSTLLKRCWDESPRARPSFEEIIKCLNLYSHDVFKTDDREVQMTSPSLSDKGCRGCVIS